MPYSTRSCATASTRAIGWCTWWTPRALARLCCACGGLGYDTGALLGHGRCQVRTWADTYLRTGGFDQADMLRLLDGMLGATPAPRIRLVADMGWASRVEGVTDDLIEFEARANFLHARHHHVVICAYDLSRFDGAFIVDILRTHPMVLIGGLLQENPFFVPPGEFLEERAMRGDG